MSSGTLGGLTDPNIFKVNIRFKVEEQQMQTGFKLRDVGVQDNDVNDVMDTVLPWVTGSFRTLLINVDELVAVDVLKLNSEEGTEHLFTGTFGTLLDDATRREPTAMAANISMKTTIRKRYGQGRMFWPIRSDFWVDASVMSAAGVAAYQGVIDALTDLFSGSVVTHDLILVNTHGILPPKPATPTTPARPEIPAKWYDVDAVKLNRTATWLRSRKIGVGA